MIHIRRLIVSIHTSKITIFHLATILAGCIITLLGLLALTGMLFHKTWLSNMGGSLIPMAPSTALLFILLGLSISVNAYTFFISRLHFFTIIIIIISTIISFTIFILSLFNIHISFEHLGFPISGEVEGAPIGYMSPITALCFTLSGISLLIAFAFDSYNLLRSIVSFCLSGIVFIASFLFFLAYIFGAPLMYGSAFIPPALNTTLAFLILGIITSTLGAKYIYLNNNRLKEALLPSFILLTVFIIFVTAISTSGYSYYRSYEKQYRITIEKQLSAVTELKVGQLVQWRKERLSDAAIFRKNTVFSDLIKRLGDAPNDFDTRNKLVSWLTPLLSAYEYNRICFHNTSGYELIAIPDNKIHTPFIFKERMSEVFRTRSVIFQDFYRDEYDQRVYLNIFIPVFDERDSNKMLGVLSFRIDPSKYLYSFIESWPIPSTTSETLIVRREGENAVFLNELRFQKNTALNLKIPLSNKNIPAVQAALGYEGIFEGIDYRGEPVIADIRTIPDSPWHIVARMDTSEIYAPLRDRMHLIVFLVIVLLIGSGASIGLIWRQQRSRFYRTQFLAEKERNWLQDVIARSLNEIYMYDPVTLKLKFANAGARYNLKYSMKELSELSIVDIKPEYTEDAYRTLINPLISGNQDVLIFETIHKRKDHTIYPVEVHLQCVETHEQSVLLSIVNDITVRKQNERIIAETELKIKSQNSLLTALINSSNDIIIFSLNRNYCYTIFNEKHRKEMKRIWDADIQPGMCLLDLMTIPELREAAKRSIDRALAGESFTETQHQPEHDIYYEFNWSPILQDDNITGITVFIMDVSERRQTEEFLRESSRKIREAQEMAHLGYWNWNIKTGDVEWSEEVYKIFRRDPKEFIPTIDSILSLSPWPEDHERDKELKKRAIENHESGFYEQKFIRPDKSTGYFISTFQGTYSESGDLVSIFGTILDITERKKSEEAIRIAHERLRRFIDSNIIGIVIATADGKIIEANDYYLNMIGFTRDEFESDKVDWRTITPDKWLPVDEKALQELREKGTCTPYEKEYLRRDGMLVPVLLADALIHGPEEQIAAFALDITDRKRAEADFIASETRYRRLFESAKDGILILDAESGMIVDVNPYLVKMLGYTYEEFLGKYIWDIGIFKDIIENKNNLETLLEKEYIRYDDLPLQTADDIIINVEFVSNIYLVNNQKVIQCNIRDITERKKAELELRIKNQVFEDSIAAQSTANLKGELTHINPAMVRMWGYKNVEGLIGKNVAALFANSDDAAPVFEALNTSGEWNGEFQALRADGTIFISRGYATCMKNTHGEIIGYQSANIDVTKEREADALVLQTSADLARSNRDLEQFANVASHDLQEPLRMVASYTQLLADRYKDHLDEKANTYIHYAVDGAVRMQRLINDLLMYSRVGTRGKQPELVDSHKILGEALVNLSAAIQDSHAIITNENMPVVFVDATQLLQVFQNIISNAIKFCRDRSPNIHVSVHDSGSDWIFSVKDNGIGIESKYAERLFVIFQRLHTREEYPGTGIGLALCKRIIDRHGGRIWFESEPGKGSIFYFTLKKTKEAL